MSVLRAIQYDVQVTIEEITSFRKRAFKVDIPKEEEYTECFESA